MGPQKEKSLLVKLDVTVQLQDTRWKAALKPYGKTVEKACEAALEIGIRDSGFGIQGNKKSLEMAVVLADDAFIRDLNKTYRGKNTATNVLAFPGDEGQLGDVILAFDTVKREAKAQGKTLRAHATHLLVHGTLHLAGFDHMKEKEAARMEALEIKILESLGLANPYD